MHNSVDLREIRVFVIAVDLIIRNNQLYSQLLEIFSKEQIFIINAIKPNSITNIEMQTRIKQNEILLGRKVTPTEVAISLSHKKCLTLAFEMRASSTLILEDDIDFSNPIAFKKLLRNLKISNDLKIWTFYSPEWSVWRKSNGRWIAVIPPAYATAYLLNSQGLERIQNSQHVGLSDWPTWSKYFDFELILNSTVFIKDVYSYAEHERTFAIAKKFKLKSLFKFYHYKEVGIYNQIRYIFIYPFVWKVLSITRKTLTKNVFNKSAIFLGRMN